MIKAKNAIIGVDILDSEIRIVEVRYRSGQPHVTNVGSTQLSDGIVHHGTILLPAALAVALRTLLDSLGISGTSRAAFGVPIELTTLRTFELPPARSDELALMVEGEVEHHGLHAEEGGAHGYFELDPPFNPTEVHPVNVAIFAIEGNAIAELKEVANRADLSIAGVEPGSLAMYRAAVLLSTDTSPCFTLCVGETGSEIAYTAGGRIKAYRRLDAGGRAILGEAAKVRNALATEYMAPVETIDAPIQRDPSTVGEGQLIESGVLALSTELRRTLNFFERQIPESKDVDRLVLLTDDPSLTPLADRIHAELGVQVEVVIPNDSLADNQHVRDRLTGPAGVRFMGALGLALASASTGGSVIPSVDLYSDERKEAAWLDSAKNLWGSIIVSAAALILAVIGYMLFGAQISSVNQQTKAAIAREKKIKADTDEMATAATRKLKQYMTLRKEGAPIGSVADAIAASLDPAVGITSISISPDLKLTILGEALDEQEMQGTVQKLQQNPLVMGLAVTSYTRLKDNPGVNFQLSAQTISMDHVRLPGEPTLGKQAEQPTATGKPDDQLNPQPSSSPTVPPSPASQSTLTAPRTATVVTPPSQIAAEKKQGNPQGKN